MDASCEKNAGAPRRSRCRLTARHEALLDDNGVMHWVFEHHHMDAQGCDRGVERKGAMLVDDSSIARATLAQADDDILGSAISDEALEAAAGYGQGERFTLLPGPTDCRCC
jgi:hypothetical protein